MRAVYTECIIIFAAVLFAVSMTVLLPTGHVYADEKVNKENLITEVKNPSNGVIKYSVTVPAGEKVDYSVKLTPDKKSKAYDKVKGTWTNKARKTVKKTITVRVKYLSSSYTVQASYSKERRKYRTVYKDSDKAVSALKTSVVTSKLKWDYSLLGNGNKNWKYRYKYVPFKDGFKKYIQVYNAKGQRIKNYVKDIVPITTITKIM